MSWDPRHGSDPELLWLWLWHRLVATVPTGPLAWEPPYAVGAAIKKKKKGKKRSHRASWCQSRDLAKDFAPSFVNYTDWQGPKPAER